MRLQPSDAVKRNTHRTIGHESNAFFETFQRMDEISKKFNSAQKRDYRHILTMESHSGTPDPQATPALRMNSHKGVLQQVSGTFAHNSPQHQGSGSIGRSALPIPPVDFAGVIDTVIEENERTTQRKTFNKPVSLTK